jgi:hypothetical protein
MSPSDRPCRQAHLMRTETFDDILTDNGIVNLLRVNMIIWEEDADLPHLRPLRSGGEAGDVSPGVESLAHLLAVHGGRDPVTPRADVLGDGTIRGEKALRVPG